MPKAKRSAQRATPRQSSSAAGILVQRPNLRGAYGSQHKALAIRANRRTVASLERILRSGALLGRNQDTVFFDATRLPASIEPQQISALWLRDTEEPGAVGIFEQFVGDRKGVLCGRINEMLRETSSLGSGDEARYPFCGEAQALLSRVPVLKEKQTMKLEALQRELQAEANEALDANIDAMISEMLQDADKQEAALARTSTAARRKHSMH